MDKQWADKWVQALRSGKYTQVSNGLHTDAGYCCLGVLCDVVGEKFDGKDDGFYACLGSRGTLPEKVMRTVGMKTATGTYEDNIFSLAEDNDRGESFDGIADIIEERWRDL